MCVGKVHPSHGCAYFPWGGEEHSEKSYEVLCYIDWWYEQIKKLLYFYNLTNVRTRMERQKWIITVTSNYELIDVIFDVSYNHNPNILFVFYLLPFRTVSKCLHGWYLLKIILPEVQNELMSTICRLGSSASFTFKWNSSTETVVKDD